MTPLRIALAVLVIVPAAACIMPDQFSRLENDVADVQQQVAAAGKAQADLSKKVAELKTQVGGGDVVKRTDVADLSARLDDVVRQSTATSDKLDQVNARVDRLSQDVQAVRESTRRSATAIPSAAAAAPGTQPAGGGPDAAAAAGAAAAAAAVAGSAPVSAPNPNALYTSAYADFSKGNYALAIQGFQEFATRYPDADLADNAQYWIGECRFSQGAFKDAVAAFDGLLASYPGSDKAAAANLKKALAFLQQNQVGQGVEQLRYVVATYPGGDEARIAKDRLASLGNP